jgi:hypothetical protein
LTAIERVLTVLRCDKVCVCTHDVHIAAAPVTFAVWALIVSGDNGLNGLGEIDGMGRSALQGLYQRPPEAGVLQAVDGAAFAGRWGFSDGCRLTER